MDSLKTLMGKREYELVLAITKNSTDPTSLFYRISAFIGCGKPKDALLCISKHQKLLEKANLSLLIKTNIEILCIEGDFDAAYERLDYYKNLPYESQVVEEQLAFYAKFIRNKEKESLKPAEISDEEVIKKLENEKSIIVLEGLKQVKGRNLKKFLPLVKKIMVSFPMQAIRSFALMLLVDEKYNEEVEFLNVKEMIKVIPSSLEEPFKDETFKGIVKTIQTDFKDPSLSQNALNIYSTYLIYIYPNKCVYGAKAMLCALYGIANEFLQADYDLEKKCLEEEQNPEEIAKIIEELKGSIEQF